MRNNSEGRNVCRLCLKTIFGDYLAISKKIVAEISDVLLWDLNFDISDDPIMCEECESSLENATGFKTSRKMLPSLYSSEEILQYLKTTSELNTLPANMNMCHFCIKVPTLVRRIPEATENLFLLEILRELNSEMKMVSMIDPITCDKCYSLIQDVLQFTTTCLNVEEKIRTYVHVEGTNPDEQVDLCDVQVFLTKAEYRWDLDSVGDNGVEHVQEIDNDETEIEVVTETENSVTLRVNGLTAPHHSDEGEEDTGEILIKNEEIEIKVEDDLSSFQEPPNTPARIANTLTCSLCTYSTRSSHCMKQHVLSHLSPSEVDLFRCTKCTFSTKYKTAFSRHSITHQDAGEAKVYKCEECPFETKHKYGLVKHGLVHRDKSELTTFKCFTCRWEFKKKEHLKRHVRTHMKDLPKDRCDECGYETIWKKNLKAHKRVHLDISEVSSFKCHLCPHETKLKANLRVHLKRHKRKRRPWLRCDMCDYKSKYEGFVKRHFKATHEGVEWKKDGVEQR